MSDTRNPREYYIVDTRTTSTEMYKGKNMGRGFKFIDLEQNEDFKQMKDLERKGKLKEAMAESGAPIFLRGAAKNFHEVYHMENTTKYEAVDGFVWIPKDDKVNAKKCFKSLRAIDPEVSWFPLGISMTDEELNAPDEVKAPAVKPTLK